MLKVYRNVSIQELRVLIHEGTIQGQYKLNSSSDGYVCVFPGAYAVLPGIVIEIEVQEEDILGSGTGRYYEESLPEFYIEKYSKHQVKICEKCFDYGSEWEELSKEDQHLFTTNIPFTDVPVEGRG